MAKKLVKLPGAAEADAISHDLEIALQGSAAWVRVGLRLIDVKGRLPHGDFVKWMNSFLSHVINFNQAHLYRAKAVAEHLLKSHKFLPESALEIIADDEHPIWNDVAGKSTRQLSLEVREHNQSLKEIEAQQHCEMKWAEDAELCDAYEPRCLSGELSYIGAKAAMIGLEHGTDAEGKRPKTDHTELMRKNFEGASRHFQFYDTLPVKKKETVHEAALNFAKNCPPSLANLIRKNLPTSDE